MKSSPRLTCLAKAGSATRPHADKSAIILKFLFVGLTVAHVPAALLFRDSLLLRNWNVSLDSKQSNFKLNLKGSSDSGCRTHSLAECQAESPHHDSDDAQPKSSPRVSLRPLAASTTACGSCPANLAPGTPSHTWSLPMRRVSPSQQGEALRTVRSPAVFIVVAVTALVAPGWLPSALGVLPTNQRDALVSLYSATGGASWTTSTNWLTGDPCTNNWVGVLCSGTTSLATTTYLLLVLPFRDRACSA